METEVVEPCHWVRSCRETFDCVTDARTCILRGKVGQTRVNWRECNCLSDFISCAEHRCGIVELHTEVQTFTHVPCDDVTGLGLAFMDALADEIAEWFSEDDVFELATAEEPEEPEEPAEEDPEDDSEQEETEIEKYILRVYGEDVSIEDAEDLCEQIVEFANEVLAEDCDSDVCSNLEMLCDGVEEVISKKRGTQGYDIIIGFSGASATVASLIALLSLLVAFFL
eukprot:TRINITY_DN274_c0_g1_i2.p1 TRINITY_DN274_c0_g1~~TRINITY_DN274_c0_g1_i2.p1  ORF type:complete len:226 (+),score=58.75 TRINITY_DN274_c0_g1_i2:306-983(+)